MSLANSDITTIKINIAQASPTQLCLLRDIVNGEVARRSKQLLRTLIDHYKVNEVEEKSIYVECALLSHNGSYKELNQAKRLLDEKAALYSQRTGDPPLIRSWNCAEIAKVL